MDILLTPICVVYTDVWFTLPYFVIEMQGFDREENGKASIK
mgnify:CR=1 FL=1